MLTGKFEKRRRPLFYALAAALIAAATVAGLEAGGSMLTSAQSGLGGKLAPADGIAPARSPAR